jgi:RimJ/RimL family protein N-acetyltransferase
MRSSAQTAVTEISKRDAFTAERPSDARTAPAVHLRLLDDRDRDLYHALHRSAEVMHAIGPPLAADEIEARLGRVLRHNRAANPGHRAWVIDAGEPRRPRGLITLLRDGARAELGVILSPDAWGARIATRAIQRVLPIAFGEMRLRCVDASRPGDGHAEVIERLLIPLGFRHVAGLRPGEVGWALDRAEYQAAVAGATHDGRVSP